MQNALAPELERWRSTPKPATVVLTALAKRGWLGVAGQVLQEMMKERLEVNVFHFTAVIAACDRKNWQLSLLLLEEMVKLQIAPNQISYSSTATSCASAAYWHLSLDLLYAMPLKRLTPDQVSFNAAIDAYRGVSWECAVDLLLEMPRRRLLQDAVSFGAAISACERDSEWQAVLELLSLMYKMKVNLGRCDISCSKCSLTKSAAQLPSAHVAKKGGSGRFHWPCFETCYKLPGTRIDLWGMQPSLHARRAPNGSWHWRS